MCSSVLDFKCQQYTCMALHAGIYVCYKNAERKKEFHYPQSCKTNTTKEDLFLIILVYQGKRNPRCVL